MESDLRGVRKIRLDSWTVQAFLYLCGGILYSILQNATSHALRPHLNFLSVRTAQCWHVNMTYLCLFFSESI